MVDVGVHVPSNEKKAVGMLHVRIPCMFVHKMHHFTIYSIYFFFIELFTLLVGLFGKLYHLRLRVECTLFVIYKVEIIQNVIIYMAEVRF
jgi:hypothetical protein